MQLSMLEVLRGGHSTSGLYVTYQYVPLMSACLFKLAKLPWGVGRDVHKGQRAHSRSPYVQNGEIAINVLGVCGTKRDFVYALAGWKGSTADLQILRDALTRQNGLQVPKGYYYLNNAGYPNAEEFLAPHRGQQYHLQEWRSTGNASINAKEYFNMKHSSARNMIEHAFCVLNGR
ncbi:retrotransposon protein [Cucumis melo var. makuwa]|uniref:Retrotransposon protein n=1 Tax=Cucumis melo var. makuwa TaxID=1194695 RepID=A0A5D3C1J1_CUCMM|nr:retrotransposon protein [Cucumis melo var. makuwa]TYK05813.1 retrotransposon protein [Cucumis melo var. makuwa]